MKNPKTPQWRGINGQKLKQKKKLSTTERRNGERTVRENKECISKLQLWRTAEGSAEKQIRRRITKG
jgi:hypothetical protein